MLEVTIADVETVADGVRAYTLAPVGQDELPAWEPGAHVDVHLPSGVIRQYSLCGDPSDLSTYTVAVLRSDNGRGGSLEMHGLQRDQQIRISPPRNNFALLPAKEYVFVAGGIGITPILPMIEHSQRAGVPWRLVYGGRTQGSMAFVERIEALGGDVTLVPEDVAGRLDLPSVLSPAQPDTLVYCCGPTGLLEAVENHCGAEWEPGALNLERFTSPTPGTTLDQPETGSAVELQLGSDGPVIEVAEDESLLHALVEAGCDVMYSCEEGICGSCELTVLEGEADHRDSLLSKTQREEGLMLVCVSRARSARLVLDIDPP